MVNRINRSIPLETQREMTQMFDETNLEEIDYSYEELSNYDKDDLIEIVQFLHKENDRLRDVKRTKEGEEIVEVEELVDDEEEIIQ